MKNLVLTLSLLAGPALAENDICAEFGRLAEYSMNARLSGAPFSSVFGRLKDEVQDLEEDIRNLLNRLQVPQDQRGDLAELALLMARRTYEEPRSSGDEDQRTVAIDFRNKVEMECYTEISDAVAP